jgi:tRNA (cytidine/uridine-2'-O-)-methyltransferase
MRVALFQPEIAGNVGAVLRLGACLGVPVDLIEPMGFAWDDARVRRTAMDYIDHVEVNRYPDFAGYRLEHSQRLVLMTTKSRVSLYEAKLERDDILLFGQESAGVPANVSTRADLALRIPLRPEVRSFNLASSVAMTLGEALRQTGTLP